MHLSIATRIHLWWTWLRVAARHVGAAKRARLGEAVATKFESAESAALSIEFESSIVAIAAVAFAMEALDKALETDGHRLDSTKFKAPPKTNRGFYVAQRLIQAFNMQSAFADELPIRLSHVFELRNGSVHFESVIKSGLKAHPSGQNTAEELTIYTLEECLAALQLGREVLAECGVSVGNGRHDASVAAIARELAGVLAMLDEAIQGERLP